MNERKEEICKQICKPADFQVIVGLDFEIFWTVQNKFYTNWDINANDYDYKSILHFSDFIFMETK